MTLYISTYDRLTFKVTTFKKILKPNAVYLVDWFDMENPIVTEIDEETFVPWQREPSVNPDHFLILEAYDVLDNYKDFSTYHNLEDLFEAHLDENTLRYNVDESSKFTQTRGSYVTFSRTSAIDTYKMTIKC